MRAKKLGVWLIYRVPRMGTSTLLTGYVSIVANILCCSKDFASRSTYLDNQPYPQDVDNQMAISDIKNKVHIQEKSK